MTRKLSDLLKSIPDAAGRGEVLSLGREVHDVSRGGRQAPGGATENELLERLIERIRWHFRAARYAIPSPDELRTMIDAYFDDTGRIDDSA